MSSPTQQAQPARATSVPALAPERPVVWPKRTVRTFANGLQVVLAESRAFPKITAQLYFRGGNAVTALSNPGLAEMTSAVVRTGTASRTSRQIEEDLRRIGAGLGTHAGADSSAISASGLAEFSGELLELIADLARNATFPQEEFDREQRQRYEELKIERTTPGFLANERIRRVLFGAHPYAIVAPTLEKVEAYKREQLVEFYRRHYVPADSLLIVVGDFSAGAMMGQIEIIFGSWSAPKPAAMKSEEPEPHFGRRVYLVDRPGTVQTQLLAGNLALTRRDPDWYRAVLANSIYGGAFHSRLVMNIREQKGYTYSPRSSLNSLREYGYFTVSAAVRNDVAAATLTEIFYEMDRMRSLPVSTEELESARNYLTGVFSLGVATQDGLLGQLSVVYLDRLPEDYLETYRQRIHELSAEDVVAAARRHLDSANSQIVMVGDRAQIGEQAALFGQVTAFDAQGNEIR
ncbi:MAG TPA: pitrilysin family protein [Candidatus Dormibacteraeota bacterium]|nr:pitrilysin family protein [Candidatus Dormibacteraeota bacterium]